MLVTLQLAPNGSKANPIFELVANGVTITFEGRNKLSDALDHLEDQTGACWTKMKPNFTSLEGFENSTIFEALDECFNVAYCPHAVNPWEKQASYFK